MIPCRAMFSSQSAPPLLLGFSLGLFGGLVLLAGTATAHDPRACAPCPVCPDPPDLPLLLLLLGGLVLLGVLFRACGGGETRSMVGGARQSSDPHSEDQPVG